MNAFKRKALMSAVAAGLGVIGSAAHAVYLDPSGLGQALIYPYYTVQNTASGNAFNTYVSVVNTTTFVKVVKVRFREGKNSREVLDFNLYLSPNDVWTGAVVPSSTSATAPGRLITSDTSCTNPVIPSTGVDFRNFAYSGANDDGLGTGLERTREGYLEMIEMGTLNAATHPGNLAVHASTGAPPCGSALAGGAVPTPGQPAVAANILAPTGGLNGTGTLINVNSGADAGYNALALSNMTAAAIYRDIGDDSPNFRNADTNSIVVSGNNAYRSTWIAAPVAFGEDAVSATIMHSNVINEYVLDSGTLSQTDWVLTFPTKHFYVRSTAASDIVPPFTAPLTANGACERISFSYFNREERGATAGTGDFSPLPPGASPSTVCWESTVVSIRNGASHMPTGTTSGVLGSVNSASVNVTTGFQNGWANLSFTGTNAVGTGLPSLAGTTTNLATGVQTAVASHTYRGLPVVGFMVRTFNNGTLTCGTAACQGNYGSVFEHKYRQNITP
jgi:hypothetical protein